MMRSVFWYLVAYALAFAAAMAVGQLTVELEPLWRAAVADVVATVVVFGFSVGLRNTSMYDAFWSVAPIPLVAFWLHQPAGPGADPLRVMLVATLVFAWGWRLTYNFFRRWKGLADEDWRYTEYRGKAAFQLVNFFGLHLLPTVVVFLGLLPVWALLSQPSAPFGALDVVALVITAGAILVETVADRQLRTFIDSSPEPGAYLERGLWAWSRHPNYFGEVAFWWGLFLFGLAAGTDNAWTVVGAVAMTALFQFISIPLMERRMAARREGWEAHCGRVSRFILWPPRRA